MCNYCGKEHLVTEICKGLTRRKFIFLTGVVFASTVLPDVKLRTKSYDDVTKYIYDKNLRTLLEKDDAFYRSLMGIPYHQSNASMGSWLGIHRK